MGGDILFLQISTKRKFSVSCRGEMARLRRIEIKMRRHKSKLMQEGKNEGLENKKDSRHGGMDTEGEDEVGG